MDEKTAEKTVKRAPYTDVAVQYNIVNESLLEALKRIDSGNRFNDLVRIRDEAQRLIKDIRNEENESAKKPVEQLQAALTQARQRANSIDVFRCKVLRDPFLRLHPPA